MDAQFSYTHSQYVVNQFRDSGAHGEFAQFLSAARCAAARATITQWQGYCPTPLVTLSDVAAAAQVGRVFYKDESARFALGSFKALGGSYAVAELARSYKDNHGHLDGFAVATATDGNHGRSVAWGAQRLGLECHIFIHAHVSQARADAMAALGAQVHRTEGNYDDSLVVCERMAAEHNWHIVSDTSWEGYESVPLQVMAGYSVMAAEIVTQLDGLIPSHFYIPAGCGGLAGAMLAYCWPVWRGRLPRIVVVESMMADCVYRSIKSQDRVGMHIVEETLMGGLSNGEVSQVVWPLLKKGVSAVITIPDEGVMPMMRWLAKPTCAERPPIEGGECSAAGLIALMASASDSALARSLGLDSTSTVLVLGTEGATDPGFYRRALSEA
ncbi:MAG: diaminopropionate ammonia-lyase [Gammaproteobacteria bacterium]|nr:diaminopropionate ammonia-lyase [Gammaproteobacteria bacterium]